MDQEMNYSDCKIEFLNDKELSQNKKIIYTALPMADHNAVQKLATFPKKKDRTIFIITPYYI